MKRAQKQQLVVNLQKDLADVRHAVVVGYRGITVPQVTELRQAVRKGGGHYRVIKNRLLKRAVSDAPIGQIRAGMTGPTALVWSDNEPVALAKTVAKYAKEMPALQVRAVLVDGQVVPPSQLEAIANLPSVDQLRAQLLGLLVSPMRRLVTALSGPPRNLTSVVKQRADKL